MRDDVPEREKHAQFIGPDRSVKPASDVLQTLRRDAKMRASRGESWVPTMEKLSELISDHWFDLPLAAKKRFLRHCRTWYDVHRFRLPPQVEGRIDDAQVRGQLSFMSATLLDAKPNGAQINVSLRERGKQAVTTKTFDVTVNCTGLEDRLEHANNPFLRALLDRKFAAIHATGSGLDVDIHGHAIDAKGRPDTSLFIVGPLTYGAFADQQGSIFIVHRILRVLPKILRQAVAH